MALEPKRLYIGNATASSVYTAPNTLGSYSIIKTINVCNTSGVDKVFSLHIVPNGGSAAANNKVLSNITVAANGVVYSDSVYVLNVSESIYYDPEDSNLTLLVTGVEYEA